MRVCNRLLQDSNSEMEDEDEVLEVEEEEDPQLVVVSSF